MYIIKKPNANTTGESYIEKSCWNVIDLIEAFLSSLNDMNRFSSPKNKKYNF